jgi:hypothetical protein
MKPTIPSRLVPSQDAFEENQDQSRPYHWPVHSNGGGENSKFNHLIYPSSTQNISAVFFPKFVEQENISALK